METDVAEAEQRRHDQGQGRHDHESAIERTETVLKDLGITLIVALLCAPLAILWGIGHARTSDYLGPNQTEFSLNYSGQITVDLGLLGDAFLPNDRFPVLLQPIGLTIEPGGIPSPTGSKVQLLSQQTLSAYVTLFTEPEATIRGVAQNLLSDAIGKSIQAEVVLLLLAIVWTQRRRFLSPRVGAALVPRRMFACWVAVLALVAGSIFAPRPPPAPDSRILVHIVDGTPFAGMTVDSALLGTVLDRGISGLELLAGRQQNAITDYINAAMDSFIASRLDLAEPGEGEILLMGFSDLHCSMAMTEVLRQISAIVEPAMVMSSGDDTMNGTAAEQFCVTRERAIAKDRPFIVATGNHDSDVTDNQMRRQGMTVLDGKVEDVKGIRFLGDDDPEYNIPFSVDRTKERPETEEQLGQRLLKTADGKNVDVVLVHQPAASVAWQTTPNPPTKLLMWGHFHRQNGPWTIPHADGSWTVALQAGTVGGIKQPTITSFSTPFTPPRRQADAYFFLMHKKTGLITGVQPVHFSTGGQVTIDKLIRTGKVDALPRDTRRRLGDEEGATKIPSPSGSTSLPLSPPSGIR